MSQQSKAFIGLMRKAGVLVVGARLFEKIRSQDVKCVLLNKDASKRSQKQIKDKCSFYKIQVIETIDANDLIEPLGQFVAAVGILDAVMAKEFCEKVGVEYGKISSKKDESKETVH